MSIEIKIDPVRVSHPTFPVLRRLKPTAPGHSGSGEVVVLFTGQRTGVALIHPVDEIGSVSGAWTRFDDQEFWEPCSITLTSET
jgi:hypothetical protein